MSIGALTAQAARPRGRTAWSGLERAALRRTAARADRLQETSEELLAINATDVGPTRIGAGVDRLTLTDGASRHGTTLREIAQHPDPLFESVTRACPNGLRVERLRVPLA